MFLFIERPLICLADHTRLEDIIKVKILPKNTINLTRELKIFNALHLR